MSLAVITVDGTDILPSAIQEKDLPHTLKGSDVGPPLKRMNSPALRASEEGPMKIRLKEVS